MNREKKPGRKERRSPRRRGQGREVTKYLNK